MRFFKHAVVSCPYQRGEGNLTGPVSQTDAGPGRPWGNGFTKRPALFHGVRLDGLLSVYTQSLPFRAIEGVKRVPPESGGQRGARRLEPREMITSRRGGAGEKTRGCIKAGSSGMARGGEEGEGEAWEPRKSCSTSGGRSEGGW